MAVLFNYMYRDASNYKSAGEVVFEGEYSQELEERLTAAFDGGQFFKASQIGIPEVFLYEDGYEFDKQDDHTWHEFCGISPADGRDKPNDEDGRTIEDFVKQVESEAKRGWENDEDCETSVSPGM
jgi:hypothetical protein